MPVHPPSSGVLPGSPCPVLSSSGITGPGDSRAGRALLISGGPRAILRARGCNGHPPRTEREQGQPCPGPGQRCVLSCHRRPSSPRRPGRAGAQTSPGPTPTAPLSLRPEEPPLRVPAASIGAGQTVRGGRGGLSRAPSPTGCIHCHAPCPVLFLRPHRAPGSRRLCVPARPSARSQLRARQEGGELGAVCALCTRRRRM